MSKFSKMKASRKDFGQLADKLKKADSGSGGGNFNDDRFWRFTPDSRGNAAVRFRFLPAIDGEDAPWVKTFNHFFKENNQWFVEECHTTIEEDCPVCQYNASIVAKYNGWQETPEDVKTEIRNRKRGQSYTANIYIIDDAAKPENNGKVFLFKFGPRIFSKIMEAVSPEFDDESPIDPFDFWEGADFKLKVRKVDGQTSYDKSEFDEPSKLLKSDDAMEKIWETQYPLAEFLSKERFKPFDEVQKKLDKVMNASGNAPITAETLNESRTSTPAKKEKIAPEPEQDSIDESSDNSATLAFFEQMAEEDE